MPKGLLRPDAHGTLLWTEIPWLEIFGLWLAAKAVVLNLGHGTSVVQLCIGVRKAFLGKAFLAGNMPAQRFVACGLWLAVKEGTGR